MEEVYLHENYPKNLYASKKVSKKFLQPPESED